ncbi:hypothetical protein AQUCO_00500540v1 [Aquilegia coerulea]|uniref:Transmembrane protein n=1 Tax=Aquilegia coerulea TaxID=218851 RepID=A0A2G5ESE2_AQUCA|nr:hypothetical protein AQUCO_00500540v1 [Aquilegia coerulea]
MQRQSLGGGSPGSKLHLQGVGVGGKDDKKLLIEDEQQQNRKDMVGVALEEDEEEKKKMIDHNRSSLTFRAEKSIHLIPILILFCLLVLYLCSYDPPPKGKHFQHFFILVYIDFISYICFFYLFFCRFDSY